MLMLTLDLQIGAGRVPLPAHLGGVLHGFVEGGIKNHAPHLLPVLRPQGSNQLAEMMIQPPPFGEPIRDHLRFGIILYGTSAGAWPVILRALLEQQSNGINGRYIQIVQVWSINPLGQAYLLVEQGRLLEGVEEPPITHNIQSLADSTPAGNGFAAFYRLAFRSPLLLASRKAQRDRERIAHGLPLPGLGSVLDSIAARLRALEPELADALNLPPDWTTPQAMRHIEPLTPAASPVQQIAWEYSATPRSTPDTEEHQPPGRRTLLIPGIVGDLLYHPTGIEHEHTLLHWGQWLGVGQKTTMGCGCYALRNQ
ncbi:MAG: CRISPR system precrRNA processing endoribonuclease RAMP protein Cas6 [Gammaproteobacteria bacterium]|nr:CRISPR system precrRNA processing endoribonuclease RAMP protein Cas6 [Gammaproteobacteria bacterium]MBU1654087.1 CRISPR system precrRNA processing endoribonuclease RAMP protein Cas6 [Gammaproteobacteria bacterium]MBU1961368.1 CRISPR system precrRNA processing endoribonuclease RAMP protein Cas6 [Gammaproteobacteria bacterium]